LYRLRSSKLARYGVVLLCLAGAWISGQLLIAHAGPWPEANPATGFFNRLCAEGADGASGCAALQKSNWSAFDITIPAVTSGLKVTRHRVVIPVAFVGLAYFVSLGVWCTFAGAPATWGRWYVVPLVAVAAGACGSITLLWVLLVKLESQCTWCIISHAINGLLLIGVLAMRPARSARPGGAAPERRQEDCRRSPRVTMTPSAALRIIGFAVLVVIGLWMYRGAKLETRQQVTKLLPYKEFVDNRKDDPAFLLREFYAEPEQILPGANLIDGEAQIEDVPTVTIFTDFQCSQCACFAQKWQTRYRHLLMGPIQVDLRHFPLSRECNDSMVSDLHPESCDASYAAEAARSQGGDEAFWKLHDLLFESTRRLNTKPYAELATRIGLDGEQLLADMGRPSVRQSVARDVALAEELGVHATPTVFVNGRRVPSFCVHNSVFWEALSAELQRSTCVAAFAKGDTALETPGHDHAMTRTAIADR
jgi:uncharacterized membrane protein